MPSYGVNHESGTLKRVMVHHPGKELELANQNPVKHHFEMPVDTKRFIDDHQTLMDALEEEGVEERGLWSFMERDHSNGR